MRVYMREEGRMEGIRNYAKQEDSEVVDDKKMPVITKDEAISKLRLFQTLITSRNWEDKECVVALQMGIRAIQQPEIVRCKDCKFGTTEFDDGQRFCEPKGEWHDPDYFCADGKRKDGDGE